MPSSQNAQTRHLTRNTLCLVLAGGRGSRLKQLTDRRAKPAVFFGGKFRIIDFVMSNCLNSGMRRIGVLTQYKSHSLLRHLQRGWSFLRNEMNEFVDLLPAQQQITEEAWYAGTADAVYQNLGIIRNSRPPEYIIVLAGDHIYKMDYAVMLEDHVRSGKGCTVGCLEATKQESTAFGVMGVDTERNVTSFVEKPKDPPEIPGRPGISLASMGIYVFNAEYLYRLLEEDAADPTSKHDFGGNILPRAVAEGQVLAHPYSLSAVVSSPEAEPYWRDVGTLDAYWEANMDLASVTPSLDMYDRDWPIWTYQEQLAPAKFVIDRNGHQGSVVNSLVSGGCIVSGSHLNSCVLFSNVRIHSFCTIEEAVLMPSVVVHRHCRLRKVIIDRRCEIPEGLVVGEDPELDAQRFERTENGVVLITREMLSRL